MSCVDRLKSQPEADIRSDGMDYQAYRFARALLTARQVDREAAALICQ
jgi:hypothetical protein